MTDDPNEISTAAGSQEDLDLSLSDEHAASEEGLVEETGPIAEPAAQAFVKRGMADLTAAEGPKPDQPRSLSHDAVDEDRTSPGLRIPVGTAPPAPASSSGEFISVPKTGEAPAGGFESGQVPLQRPPASQSGSFASSSTSNTGIEFGSMPMIATAAPLPVKKGALRRLMPTVVTGLFTFSVIAWAIVTQWAPPHVAVILMAGAMLVPTLFIALFLSTESKNSVFVRALPALIISVCGIGAAATWSLEDVRARAVPYAPDRVLSMEKMFADPSLALAATGCRRFIVHHTDPTWWTAIFEVMSARPELAERCLDGLPEGPQKRIARSLADRWSRELVTKDSKLDESEACRKAVGITALPLPIAETSSRLLGCNLGAVNPVCQKCCGRALAATVSSPEEWAARVREVVEFDPKSLVPSGVFSMAFHGQGLTPAQVEFVDDVKFSGNAAQLAALEVACEMIPAKDSNVIQHLQAALDDQCPSEVREVPKDRETWSRICATATQQLRAGVDLSPVSTLCQLTSNAALPRSIAAARDAVHLAMAIP